MSKVKLFMSLCFLTAAGVILSAFAADETFGPKIYKSDGGDKLTVVSGGTIQVETGGTLQVDTGATFTFPAGAFSFTDIDAGSSGTAGSLDIFPSTASKGKLNFVAADSAGDTTTTVTNASQAGARTYTIPDAGASASFVMTEGAQTLSGVKTFNSTPVFFTATFTVGGTTISSGEISVLDSVTGGTAAANKALVLDASADITGVDIFGATEIDAGSSGSAGGIDIFPATASKGKLRIFASDMAGDTTTQITVAEQSGARTYTVPDVGGSAEFMMDTGAQNIAGTKTFLSAPAFPAAGFTVDGVTPSVYKCVDSTVTAATLDGGGSEVVLAGVAGDQYKIREIMLHGGGTSYGSGGDRLIRLTDGTTTFVFVPNATIEGLPGATARWGDTAVPFNGGDSNTKTVAGQNIRWEYSGGTTDHSGTGSVAMTVCLEKTD